MFVRIANLIHNEDLGLEPYAIGALPMNFHGPLVTIRTSIVGRSQRHRARGSLCARKKLTGNGRLRIFVQQWWPLLLPDVAIAAVHVRGRVHSDNSRWD